MLVINFALYFISYTPITMKIAPKRKRDGWKKHDKKHSETRCETESGKVYRVQEARTETTSVSSKKKEELLFKERERYPTSINF